MRHFNIIVAQAHELNAKFNARFEKISARV
jgi:hypothetical protein